MVTTGCEGCCFLRQDNKGKGCSLGQFCVTNSERTFAPGYCRLCRSHKWARRQGSANLYKAVVDKCALKFDMLVLFDESRNSIEDLEHTLSSDWYVKYAEKVIIMDVTGFGDRKNTALQYLKSREHSVHTIVDSSVVHETVDLREETMRRFSKKVTAPFFLVISAGQKIKNLHVLSNIVQYFPSRVIHWLFSHEIGMTAIIPNSLHSGLFVTIPYQKLMKSPEVESFSQQLRKEEDETGMGLSMFCRDVWLT